MTEETKDIMDIYTNSIRVSTGLYEITLTLRLTTPIENGVSSKNLMVVRMSPHQAFALNELLTRSLELYTDKFGEVTLPKELTDQFAHLGTIKESTEESTGESTEESTEESTD